MKKFLNNYLFKSAQLFCWKKCITLEKSTIFWKIGHFSEKSGKYHYTLVQKLFDIFFYSCEFFDRDDRLDYYSSDDTMDSSFGAQRVRGLHFLNHSIHDIYKNRAHILWIKTWISEKAKFVQHSLKISNFQKRVE